MIPISLSEKFCCQNLITSIKVINMTRNSSTSNKLRNINTIGCFCNCRNMISSRMLLQLQKYDLEVRFVGGKNVPIGDLLSRQPLPDTQETAELDIQVHTFIQSLFITDRRLESVRTATLQDPQMQILKKTILEGWPEIRSECSPPILDFWNNRDELSAADALIFRGQTLLIPKSLRQQMIETVHTGHLGTQKSLQRAKDVMFLAWQNRFVILF